MKCYRYGTENIAKIQKGENMKNIFIMLISLVLFISSVVADEFTSDTGPLGVKYSNVEAMGEYFPTIENEKTFSRFINREKKIGSRYQIFSSINEYSLDKNISSKELFFGKSSDYYKMQKEFYNISIAKMSEGSLGVLQSNTSSITSSGSNMIQGAGIGAIAGIFVQGLLFAKDAYDDKTKDAYYKVSIINKDGKFFKITSLFVYTGTYDFSDDEIRSFINKKEAEKELL